MAQQNAMEMHLAQYEAEKLRTQECVADVRQELSHADHVTTRRQLIGVLRKHIQLIEAGIDIDKLEQEIVQSQGQSAAQQPSA